ncbi:hypothetical protein PIB30_091263 [Stylosanthes scabra]|uniref:Secreted protein n=1 Tax=Stylosanthes scabra TaxID=79078 RepID=A0ABU6RUR2_9FABA|nr:hypothetical protein [Stylosanthes scabra]
MLGSGLMRQSLCATGLLPGRIDSLWLEKLGSIPGISAAVHANRSTFLLRKWVSSVLTPSGRVFAIIVICSASGPTCTFSSSPSSCGLYRIFLPGGSRSTRWILAAVSGFMGLGSCSLELCSVASWHLSASEMSPFSVPTSPLFVMNFMVRIDVATITPILFKVGLSMIAL